MRLLTHPATTAFGLATLYVLARIAPLVSSRHLVLYHWSGPAIRLFLPNLLIFCLLWIALTLLLLSARKRGRWSVAVWAALAFTLPYVLLRESVMLSGNVLPLRLSAAVCGLTLAAVTLLVIQWKPSFLVAFERARGLMATAIGFVAVATLLIFGQLLWFGWKARNLNVALPLHRRVASASAPASAKTRIVWILFDELSFQQVYERRFPGLQLPAFDRLASQSTLFTDTIPAGSYTEDILPSLFTAQPVDGIRASSDGRDLFLHNPDTLAWQRFDQHRTVFQDALNAGYSTAVAGWYNPYCRILPQVLDQCFWTFDFVAAGTTPARSVAGNLLDPVHRALAFALSLHSPLRRTPQFDWRNARLHELDYTRIYSAADDLLEDRSANFIFLHMPVPHPNGIYDRTTGDFATTHSTYIDNLALADKYLAHVRAVLEQNGTWDSSAVIVMGDHSWRTNFMWKPKPSWTHEEQVASNGGQFDDRPAYIVKLPRQQQPAHIDSPYAAIHTRALLDALAHDRIRTPDDLSAWTMQWAAKDKPLLASAK